ncbi:hypothetical protein TNCV_2304961 [Trichonephila clavipes]|nr:hypothetical protein TNCV_2304961 [Trichonephila clavipes]
MPQFRAKCQIMEPVPGIMSRKPDSGRTRTTKRQRYRFLDSTARRNIGMTAYDCHGWLGCSPIFDDFSQHLWPYIGNNTANVVFQMVKHLWLIRIDQ